jgi:hypothetical protein
VRVILTGCRIGRERTVLHADTLAAVLPGVPHHEIQIAVAVDVAEHRPARRSRAVLLLRPLS